jgi:carbonic anhydrase
MAIEPPQDLLDGYRRFRQDRFPQLEKRYRALAQGQSPRTLMIACADSRVDPATIFTAAPGELLVVRNVANLVPPCERAGTYHGTSAALEFAIQKLAVSTIVVLGHGLCGGIAVALAAAETPPTGQFLAPWVTLMAEAREEVMRDASLPDDAARQRALEHLTIRQSLANLQSFPFIREAVTEQRLALHCAWFSIAEGELHWLDQSNGAFVRMERD